MKISVVIPMYNEQESAKGFAEVLINEGILPAKSEFSTSQWELVFVNDGSSDKTLEKLHNLSENSLIKENCELKIISLSRNFGKEVAVAAGINYASGDYIISLDGDGQHPPRLFKEFITKAQGGAQVVMGMRRATKGASFLKKFTSKIFYKIFNFFSDDILKEGETDYVLITSEVAKEFIKIKEHNRINRGLINWLGFRKEYIEFQADERIAGNASYSFGALMRLAINSITALSTKPLSFIIKFGCVITFTMFILDLLLVIEKYLLKDCFDWNISGAAIIGVAVVLLAGVILIFQGITALYIAKIHQNTQNRPLFVINHDDSKI